MIEGKKCTDFPHKVPRALYDTIIKTATKRMKAITNNGLYISGSITIPGLSDIDFIVVGESVPHQVKKCFSFYGDSKYVLLHEPLYLSSQLANMHHTLITVKGYEWEYLTGKKEKFPTVNTEYALLRRLDDFVINNYHEILKYKTSKHIHMRMLLSKLHKVVHLADLITDTSLKKKFIAFGKKVVKLRKAIFTTKKEIVCRQSLSLLDEAFLLYEDLIIDIENNTKPFLTNPTKQEIKFVTDRYEYYFTPDWRNKPKFSYGIFGKKRIYLPPVFASSFVCYAKEKTQLGKYIRSRMQGTLKGVSSKLQKQCHQMMKYYQAHIDYARENRLHSGPILNFKLHYKPQTTFKCLKLSVKQVFRTCKARLELQFS